MLNLLVCVVCLCLAGKHVARGNASKAFHPFLLPGELKGTLEELRNKLLVDLDPLKCLIGDLEASSFEGWMMLNLTTFFLCLLSPFFALVH